MALNNSFVSRDDDITLIKKGSLSLSLSVVVMTIGNKVESDWSFCDE